MEAYSVGFTGTKEGLSLGQWDSLTELIDKLYMEEFHHGGCIGADAEADGLVAYKRIRSTNIKIIQHPPTDEKYYFGVGNANVICEAKPYLERNHNIVDDSHFIIACPKETDEEVRSGTWATVRYARKMKRTIAIIKPDGTVVMDVQVS